MAYSDSEAADFGNALRSVDVVSAPNALYSWAELNSVDRTSWTPTLLYVGRLAPDKSVDLILEAVAQYNHGAPVSVRVVIAGDGESLDSLRDLALSLADFVDVDFIGPTFSFEELLKLYKGIGMVAVGRYAGLSLTQAAGFGVPALVSIDAPNAPEICLANEVSGSVVWYGPGTGCPDLVKAIDAAMEQQTDVDRDRASIAYIRDNYNIETLVDGLCEAITIQSPQE